MNKVYLLLYVYWDDWEIVGVYSSQEIAEAWKTYWEGIGRDRYTRSEKSCLDIEEIIIEDEGPSPE